MIDLDVLSKADVAADGQPKFWRSQADLHNAAGHQAIVRDEFHPGATDRSELDADPGPSRRSFMKVMGASLALSGVGLSGCRRPAEAVLPYARKPEEIVPGIANFYATAMPFNGYVEPLLVESHEGRPTKVEGNPEHPMSLGASTLYAQASILNLYDPDRSRTLRGAGGADAAALADTLRDLAPGTRLTVLAEPTSSPTVQRLRDQVQQRFPNAQWITYRGLGASHPARPLFRFSQAQTIVSFDADFLGGDSTPFHAREYAESRRADEPGDTMSRLYAIESAYTTTGGMADHRLALKAGAVSFFAAAVGAALGQGGARGAELYADHPFVQAIAEDARAGTTIFVAGETQPAAVHALCARLNAAYSAGAAQYLNTGQTEPVSQAQAMQTLARQLAARQVDALVILGPNPVYDAPVGLGFAAALENVPLSIHLGPHFDETAGLVGWHIPRAHYLEQWGDGRAYDGTYSVIQPLIAPLYEDAMSEIELLNMLAGNLPASGYDLVRDTIRQQGLLSGNFEDAWRQLLHDGFLPNTAFAAGGAAPTGSFADVPPIIDDALEVVVRPDPKMYDGAFSNNAWMQELPDPVTKVTWDAVAQMSVITAQRLGVEVEEGSFEGGEVEAGRVEADVITIRVGEEEITLPAWIQPGHPNDSITITTGFGRQLETERVITDRNILQRLFDRNVDIYQPGPVANGIGANANAALLRDINGGNVIPAAEVEVTGDDYMIATTQDHGSMEGRPLVRMATLEEFRTTGFPRSEVKPVDDIPWEDFPALWEDDHESTDDEAPDHDATTAAAAVPVMYADHQWGMTVDLNACSGCNACVVACQSENNIMVVGKDQVARGREMHWLRMDRYYVTSRTDEPFDTEDELADMRSPGMVMQPMLCQHCENAPCEQVCPVAATVHSPDGLNVMVYNRCIGTRYCSNNCPYKVRRFNFYNWTKTLPIETQMAMNPNVTMRFRGVMEKCTFCVHRIRAANQVAHIENRKIRDGEVVTACQQVCPTNAIVFGDISDPNSQVSQTRQNARRYELLEELAVRPRLSYLARLRNPNPALANLLGEHDPVQPVPTHDHDDADALEAEA